MSDGRENQAGAKAHLKEHGWVRIPSVLTRQEAAHALDRLWKAKAAVEAEGEETYLQFLDPNPSNVRVFYLMAVDEIFRDLIAHPTAVEMVRSVLGDNFLISNFTANIALPGSKSMALHSDQSLVFPDPWKEIWALNVIWCKYRWGKHAPSGHSELSIECCGIDWNGSHHEAPLQRPRYPAQALAS